MRCRSAPSWRWARRRRRPSGRRCCAGIWACCNGRPLMNQTLTLTPSAYTLLGLTAMVAALAAVMTFALLRFFAAARDTRRDRRGSGAETALLSAALQEAVTKLRAQERATAAR